MKYHIIASKQIKECKCSNCRAKYGQYHSKEAAEEALAELTKVAQAKNTKENLGFSKISIPPSPTTADTSEASLEILDEDPDDEDSNNNKTSEDEVEDDDYYIAEELEENEDDNPDEDKAKVILSKKLVKPSVNDYFEDDEEFLAGDDKVLSLEESAALFEQSENLISWRLENFYDDDGKRRGRYSLRANPPILRVESSSGENAEFVLTKDFAITLANVFDTVKRGYYGVDGKKNTLTQDEAQGKFAALGAWGQANPVKAIFAVIIIVMFVVTAFTL